MKPFILSRQEFASLILRLGLAFSFTYAAIMSFILPYDWLGFFPAFIQDHFPASVVVTLFGISQLIISAWLVWGKHLFIPSVIATILLFGIIIFNLNQFPVLFRDVSILAMSVSLAILNYPRIISPKQ